MLIRRIVTSNVTVDYTFLVNKSLKSYLRNLRCPKNIPVVMYHCCTSIVLWRWRMFKCCCKRGAESQPAPPPPQANPPPMSSFRHSKTKTQGEQSKIESYSSQTSSSSLSSKPSTKSYSVKTEDLYNAFENTDKLPEGEFILLWVPDKHEKREKRGKRDHHEQGSKKSVDKARYK